MFEWHKSYHFSFCNKPDEPSMIEISNINPEPDEYPNYSSPQHKLDQEPILEDRDGLLLPILDVKIDNQMSKPDNIINQQLPVAPANKVTGNKRKFDDLNDEITPPSQKRRKLSGV